MPLLKTSVTDDFVELIIGDPETEESSLGVINDVDGDASHVYAKVEIGHRAGDPLGDIQLAALKEVRELVGAEITRLTKLQQAR